MPLVLFYHRVCPFMGGRQRKMNVEPAVLREQLEAVAKRYPFVELDRLLEEPNARAAAVTFDDGYQNVVEHALPILREMKIPATFFVVAGAVGGKDTWYRGDQPIVSWDEMKQWTDAGMSVGSHSLSHRRLTRMSEESARYEIVESKRLLEEKLGGRILHFAYPQGRRSRDVERMVEQAGYRAAWATKGAPDRPFARRRVRLSANDRGLQFRFKLWKIRWGLY